MITKITDSCYGNMYRSICLQTNVRFCMFLMKNVHDDVCSFLTKKNIFFSLKWLNGEMFPLNQYQ